MMRMPLRVLGTALTSLATTFTLVALSPAATADQPAGYGPAHPFDDSIKPGDGPQPKVKSHQALIIRTAYGYRFISGSNGARLRITEANGRLRFRDSGLRSWKSLPGSCRKAKASQGRAASCAVPGGASTRNPVLLEIRPRLGNDVVDGRGLPARIEMAVLADAGRDTIYGGAGNDYLGGAMDRDRAFGGAGKDWMRGGDGRDRLFGGPHSDWIIGLEGRDRIAGGGGRDHTAQ